MTFLALIFLGLSPHAPLACSNNLDSTGLGKSISYRANGPQVILGAPTIYGSMSREIIRSILRRQRGAIQACYQKALSDQSDFVGTISAEIVVGADGRVKTIRMDSPTPGTSQALENCLREKISELKFPSTCSGFVIIKQPFEFKPKPPKKQPKPRLMPDPQPRPLPAGPLV